MDFRNPPEQKHYLSEITPEIKDAIINKILELDNNQSMSVHIRYRDIENLGISKNQFEAIISQLVDMNLINHKKGYGDSYELAADLHDFKRYGGFVMRETVLLQQIDIMILNLNQLMEEAENNKHTKYIERIEKCIGIACFINEALAKISPAMGKDLL